MATPHTPPMPVAPSAAASATPLLPVLSRFAAAILGGYLFAYGYTALATLAGFAAGLAYSEAQSLAWMTGALVYLCAIIWGFVPRSHLIAWLGLAGGGAATATAAYALSRLV